MVSVIIPSYERFDLLQNAIDSVYNQTYKDIEIIVVDDNSKDVRYLSLESDNRIKYIRLSSRLCYPGKVRNVGIQNASGDWVSFLDDDDTWETTKLEKQMMYSDKYKFISSDAFIDNRPYTRDVYKQYWDINNPEDKKELDLSILSRHNVIINSTTLIRKDLIESVGGYDIHRRIGEDYITWIKILQTGQVCYYVDEPLVRYNIHSHKYYTDQF